MIKKIKIAVILFLVLSINVTGQDVKNDFIQKMESSYDDLETLISDFSQRKSISFLEEDMLSSGKFYFVKPGLMKWDQTEPESYYFIINEKEIIRFNGDKRQKIPGGSPQALIFKEFIIGTVDGSIFKDERFESSYQLEGDKYIIYLKPIESKIAKRITEIILEFNKESLFLESMLLIEKGGDQSEISFFNQKLNETVNLDTFE